MNSWITAPVAAQNLVANNIMTTIMDHGSAADQSDDDVILVPDVAQTNLSTSQREQLLARGDFVHLNVQELPEMIYVDTRFITQTTGVPAKTLNDEQINSSGTLEVTTPAAATVKTTTTTADAQIMTESPNPTRDREQQTDFKPANFNTVATQCDLDDESNWKLASGDVTSTKEMISAEKEKVRFLSYVADNCLEHSNGKQECLQCGEVEANSQAMTSHLAVHWGPPVLCYRCGRQFEHKSLLAQHRCEFRTNKRKSATRREEFNCPYYRCRVRAISRLDLYDHINEHSAQCVYQCEGCLRNFTTICELRHHLPLWRSCRRAYKRRKSFPYGRGFLQSKDEAIYRLRVHRVYSMRKKRVCMKSFLSLRLRSRHLNNNRDSLRCQFCLKYCSNKFKYTLHSKRCLNYFLHRLKRKRSNSPPILDLTDGF